MRALELGEHVSDEHHFHVVLVLVLLQENGSDGADDVQNAVLLARWQRRILQDGHAEHDGLLERLLSLVGDLEDELAGRVDRRDKVLEDV